MSIGKYLLHVLVAYVIYAVLYILLMTVVFGDLFMANADLMRAENDPMAMYAYIGHFLQTCVVVALFNMAVGGSDVGKGVRFGLLMGGYLAATDMAMYFGLKMSTAPLAMSIAIHLLVGAIIGFTLAKLNGLGGKSDEAAA